MDFINEELARLKRSHRHRRLFPIDGEPGPTVKVDGREVILLTSNDYLGLAGHPKIKEAAAEALRRWGCGSGASRLVCGTTELHIELERRIASFVGSPSALVFGSGYLANTGVIPALAGRGGFIFSDSLNHASIIDGCRLARSEVPIYPHTDADALGQLLEKAPPQAQKLVVTESIFSMDGDLAPLDRIASVARRHGATLMVDEAHAMGVLGTRGAGGADHFDISGQVNVLMGTFGKALGSFGAFVAGSEELCEYLVNTARSFIFSTAPPPPVLASAMAALDLLASEPERRSRLLENAAFLRSALVSIGLHCLPGRWHIIPVLVGDDARVEAVRDRVLEGGVFVQAIRPPAVPEGASRLRITPTAGHTQAQMERAIEVLERVGREFGIIG